MVTTNEHQIGLVGLGLIHCAQFQVGFILSNILASYSHSNWYIRQTHLPARYLIDFHLSAIYTKENKILNIPRERSIVVFKKMYTPNKNEDKAKECDKVTSTSWCVSVRLSSLRRSYYPQANIVALT